MCFVMIFNEKFYNFVVHNLHCSIKLKYEILILFGYDEIALMQTKQNATITLKVSLNETFIIHT